MRRQTPCPPRLSIWTLNIQDSRGCDLGSLGSPLTKLKIQEQELIFRVYRYMEVQIIHTPGQATSVLGERDIRVGL